MTTTITPPRALGTDYYLLDDLLTDDARAVRDRVRSFVDHDVTHNVDGPGVAVERVEGAAVERNDRVAVNCQRVRGLVRFAEGGTPDLAAGLCVQAGDHAGAGAPSSERHTKTGASDSEKSALVH